MTLEVFTGRKWIGLRIATDYGEEEPPVKEETRKLYKRTDILSVTSNSRITIIGLLLIIIPVLLFYLHLLRLPN